MFIKQLSVFMENKAGRMAEISRILASGGVNIRALSVADTTGFGILRLIVDDPEKAERVCRAAGLTTALTDAIAISMADRPGGFADEGWSGPWATARRATRRFGRWKRALTHRLKEAG